MADPELVKILKKGRNAWNSWREQQPRNVQIDLSGANLTRADLSHAHLSYVNLNYAILGGSQLSKADLSYANLCNALLREANLYEADLFGADLSYALLNYADLSYAVLGDANLSYAHLDHAHLNAASLGGTILHHAFLQETDWTNAFMGRTQCADLDLRRVIGLETVHHYGPSTIGLDTIYQSHGQIPEVFLRGAGVPETLITNMRVLVDFMSPIEFYSCFISYSHQDDTFARHLHAYLQDRGVRCWFAPHDMKIGDKLRPRIDEAIHLQDKLLLILSKDSVASDWVEHEVETALARESKEKRTILFPIRVDNAILEREYTGWAALVQNERHIGDFTHWTDPKAYEQAFVRLLRDLKA